MRRRKGVSNLEIKEHALVPKHAKVSEKEKKELLERYNVTAKELPKIYKNDAALKSLNVDTGDVVKIARKSPTAGESVYYRVVISD
jgi:DNA-directed RNA polymerase subunit H